MKTVVTGATGFVGKWLVEELLKQGNAVTIIVRNKKSIPTAWTSRVTVIEATLDILSSLKQEDFPEKKADIFFHLAWDGTSGYDRADTCKQLKNVAYTCDAVHLASQLGCSRFVNAGSIMEYEAMAYVPAKDTAPGMGYIYSTAKLTADYMAKTVANKEQLTYINAVISNIYGVGEKSARFLNTTLRKMLCNEDIPLTHGKQSYDFIYIEDAVKAIILAGKDGSKNCAYYIGNPQQRPLRDFIEEMKFVLGSSSNLKFGEVPFTGPMLEYETLGMASLTELGFVPQVSFAEGIRRTQQWITEVEHEQ